MSGVATAIAGAAVVGAIVSSNATKDAAGAEVSAANGANATQLAEYQQTRADQAPWRESGVNALNTLNGQLPNLNRPFSMADFQADPGYQFRMDQGIKAIQRSAAARGGLDSGDTLKALSNYGQDTASAEYSNAFNRYNSNNDKTFNRLSSLAGLGQTATNATSAAGQNAANNISSNTLSSGNAQAASAIAGANNTNSLIGNGMNTWMNYQFINRFAPQNPPGTSSPY